MKIYLISGKARHGKDTIATIIKNYYQGKKVIDLKYGYYIKHYAKMISDWDGNEETKPRELLQYLGTDLIRNQIDNQLFTRRMCEDFKVYSYYFDIITVSDVRFVDEIDALKNNFKNIKTINVIRPNFETELSLKQQTHKTENSLNNYNSFDYIVLNDRKIEDLENKIIQILKDDENEC